MADMRVLRLVGFVVGGLVALLVILLLAVRLLVDPNDYKDRIAQAVKSSRPVELNQARGIPVARARDRAGEPRQSARLQR